MAELTPFHFAFPMGDLAAARDFYGRVLGCPEGRSSESWIDFDLFGHQIVAHHKPGARSDLHLNSVDGDDVPVPHFGVVLSMDAWSALAERLRAAGVAPVSPFRPSAFVDQGVKRRGSRRTGAASSPPIWRTAGTGRRRP